MYWRKVLSLSLILPLGAGVWAMSREIVINLPMFTLSLYENGQLLRAYPIAVGWLVSPTRLGETVITNKVVDPTHYPPPQWYEKGLEPIPPRPDNPVGTRWLGLGFPAMASTAPTIPTPSARPSPRAASGCQQRCGRAR